MKVSLRVVVLMAVAALALSTAGCGKLRARDQLNKGVASYKNNRYEQAIELNPDHADTHLWYSWLLLALGRRDAAFDEIEQTMSIVQETDKSRGSRS